MRKIATIICFCASVLTASTVFADFEQGMQSYREGNYQKALKHFSDDSSANAHFYLAMMYENGDGIVQNHATSLVHLQLAAEQGLDVAQAGLGLRYLEGMGVQVNEEEGMKWLRLAAQQGLVEAKSAMQMAGLEQ